MFMRQITQSHDFVEGLVNKFDKCGNKLVSKADSVIMCQILQYEIVFPRNMILNKVVFFQGGHIIFFQSLSLLGYCLFPLDIGALICMVKDNVILKVVVVSITLAWSSWSAYPFMSSAVNPRRKALALYPVFLLYVSVGFLIIAID